MEVSYILQGVQFEWDDDKAQSNIQKHGVTFEEAAETFFDPFHQTGDASVDDKEDRDFIIGYTFSQRLLLAVYTERRDKTRIISARAATRAERKVYEEAN
jgi:uncharacterized DUF497 family protein